MLWGLCLFDIKICSFSIAIFQIFKNWFSGDPFIILLISQASLKWFQNNQNFLSPISKMSSRVLTLKTSEFGIRSIIKSRFRLDYSHFFLFFFCFSFWNIENERKKLFALSLRPEDFFTPDLILTSSWATSMLSHWLVNISTRGQDYNF